MKKYKLIIRILPLFLALSLFLVGAMARLYNLQITHGADNIQQAEKRVARTVTLPAARGELLDRYGRPLVTNHVSYALHIDRDRLTAGGDAAANDVVDRLTLLMLGQGVRYEDTFPVLANPYRYKTDMSDQDLQRLNRFLDKEKWPAGIGAPELMQKLVELFGVDPALDEGAARRIVAVRYELELRRLFTTIEPYTYIAPYQFAWNVDLKLVGMIREQDFSGVVVDTVPIREYQTEFAAHLLGRVGQIPEEWAQDYQDKGYAPDELVGLDGMEYGLEDWLRGQDGWRKEETNAAGKVTGILDAQSPEPGKNCLLTIDIRLQEQVEHALGAGVESLRADGQAAHLSEDNLAGGGAAVLMNIKTGEVLAMASYPTFDLTRFQEDYAVLKVDPMSPMLNRAITGAYEPGSTFKMATAAAALETGTITPDTKVYDAGVYMYYAPTYTPRCTGTHGWVNVSGALRVSCNYFFYDVGRRTGIEAMNQYARELGFGAKTGIELPGETAGILAGPDYCALKGIHWNGGDVLQAAIGQSYNMFTPLQLCSYVATLANGGVRCQPHLLHSVKTYDYSETVLEQQPVVAETMDLKESTMNAILSGMRQVCQPGGTAAATFASYPIPVAGKTGSAQTMTNGRPTNGVFVAFAPYDDPEVAVAVVVERGGHGASVAPIARDILDAYFQGQESMSQIAAENQLQG